MQGDEDHIIQVVLQEWMAFFMWLKPKMINMIQYVALLIFVFKEAKIKPECPIFTLDRWVVGPKYNAKYTLIWRKR